MAGVLAAVLVAGPAAAMELSSSQTAVLLHDGTAGRGPVAALGPKLVSDFGYARQRVIVLGGKDATRTRIGAALQTLAEQSGAGVTDAFVLVSLPTHMEGSNLFFQTYDGRSNEPETWTNRTAIVDWISALPLRSALLVHPACVDAGATPPPLPPTARRAGRPLPIWILSYCRRELRPGRSASNDEGRGEAANALYDIVLQSSRERGRSGIQLSSVVDRLRAALPEFRFWLQEPPDGNSLPFHFVRSTPATESGVAEPVSDEDWNLRLQALVLRANKAGTGESSGGAVKTVVDIARNPAVPPASRRLAIDALEEITVPAAHAELSRVALDPAIDEAVRRAAVTSLLSKKDVATINRLLTDEHPRVREAAMRASGIAYDDASIAVWREQSASDADELVRIAAIQNLAAVSQEIDRNRMMKIAEDRSAAPAVRREALAGLGRLKTEPATTTSVLSILNGEKDPAIQRAALYALSKVERSDPSYPGVERALSQAIETGGDRIAQAASFAAGEIGADTTSSLVALLANEGEIDRPRVAAAEALAKLDSLQSLPTLVGVLESTSTSPPGLRRAAVTTLGNFTEAEAQAAVLDAIDDPDAYVRDEAIRVVAAWPFVDRKLVLEKLTGDDKGSPLVRATLLKRFEIIDYQDRDLIVGMLADPSPVVSAAAIERLSQETDELSIEAVGQALVMDRGKAVGAAAVLGRIATPSSRTILVDEARSEDPQRRRNAVLAISADSDPAAAEVVRQAAIDRSPLVRQAAADALSRSDDRSNDELLRKLAKDDAPEVKQTAIDALRREKPGGRGWSAQRGSLSQR